MKKLFPITIVLIIAGLMSAGCDPTDHRKGKNGWDCVKAIDVSAGDDTIVCKIKTVDGNVCYVADAEAGVAMTCEPVKP